MKCEQCTTQLHTYITYKNSLRDGRWKGVGSLGEGYLGEFFLDVCRWPLRTPATFVYSVGNYRPHLCHLWANVIFVTPTLSLSLTFLNLLLTRIFYWKCNPIIVNPVVKMRPHPAGQPHSPITRNYHPPPPPPSRWNRLLESSGLLARTISPPFQRAVTQAVRRKESISFTLCVISIFPWQKPKITRSWSKYKTKWKIPPKWTLQDKRDKAESQIWRRQL